jgi:hypothetical protein
MDSKPLARAFPQQYFVKLLAPLPTILSISTWSDFLVERKGKILTLFTIT